MVNRTQGRDLSAEETGFLQSDAIKKVQKVFGTALKASVAITDNAGHLLAKPFVLAPFIKPGSGESGLWKCCQKTILETITFSDQSGQPPCRECECGHHIVSFKVYIVSNQQVIVNIIKLTGNSDTDKKLYHQALNNSYTSDQALEVIARAEKAGHEAFMNACQIMYNQSELYNAILEESVVAYKEKSEEERRLTEEALIKAKNEAEESSRLKSSLLANMSHELRTPMTGILGFSEILHDELEDNRLKNMASTIYKSANRLMTTLNSIMDLSAIESNRTSLNLRAVNVKNTFMALLRNAFNIANDKGLYIRTALPPNINVVADEKLLGQLLHHLVDNAIKFTIDGGISISAYSGLRDTANVVIKISDTGIGIAPQHHKLIFEEFRQVSEGLSRTFEGSGLGLSLVMKISKLLNAKVWVESEPEKGSDFYVSLPSAGLVATELPVQEEKQETISTVRLGRGSVPEVLIVEDNEINRRLAALYLREICNIDMAENGFIAMNKIKAKKYDAILMDINLGAGPNGIHVAQEIKAIEQYKNVPIIAVTGYTMQGDREKLLANGCSHYVAKPYDKKTLIKLFSGLLYKHPVEG